MVSIDTSGFSASRLGSNLDGGIPLDVLRSAECLVVVLIAIDVIKRDERAQRFGRLLKLWRHAVVPGIEIGLESEMIRQRPASTHVLQ